MWLGLLMLALTSPVWVYALAVVFDILRDREADRSALPILAVIVLAMWGMAAGLAHYEIRYERFEKACVEAGAARDECYWKWEGESRRR